MTRSIDTFDPPEANPEIRDTPRRGAPPPRGPGAFVWSSARMGWRWLKRMRTALYLLAVVGVLSVVATLVPQEPNVPTTVAAWRAGTEGPGEAIAVLIDGFGAFDVYGSPVFVALLLLLFLSLTACLVPRVRAFWRLARHGRPPASRHLDAHPERGRLVTDRSPAEVEAAVRGLLGRRRWRLRDPGNPTATNRTDVAAEKGIIWREGGSLVFHLSFYVLLIAVVVGQLMGFRGQVGVVEGRAFADTALVYWNQWPGRWWTGADHRGFELHLDEFHVDWVRDTPFAGTPSVFRSDVTVTTADGREIVTTIAGNDPAVIDGMKIHQLDWGYAPRLVVEVDGEVVHDAHLTAISQSGLYETAVKIASIDPDLGLEVGLVPTVYDDDGQPILHRGFPWADDPHLLMAVHRGDLQLDAVQNVHQLDHTGLEMTESGIRIPLGGQYETRDGIVIRFPELRHWVGFQVSHRPTDAALLLGGLLILLGLVPALYGYRRRIWVRAEVAEGRAGTLVTVAGRAFQRPPSFSDEFQDIIDAIRTATDATVTDATEEIPPSSPAVAGTASPEPRERT